MTDYKALNIELDQAIEISNARDRQVAFAAIWEKVKDGKDNAWALFIKGRMLMIMKKPPHFCIMYLYKAIELDPTLYQAMTTLGLMLRLGQKYPEALEIFKRAEDAVRDDEEATPTAKALCTTDLGGLLQVMGDYEAAEAAFRRALADDESYWPAQMSLAGLREKLGDLDDAMATLQKAVDQISEPSPESGYSKDELQCVFATGVLRTRRNEWRQALDLFSRAWKLHPDKWNILCKIIQCHAALKNVAERNENIRQLYRLALSGKVPSDKYCREQISTPHGTILVFEMFKLSYDKGHPVVFMQWEKEQTNKELPHMVSMGSNEAVNEIQRESGQLPPNYRLYHIDAHGGINGTHSALHFVASARKPTYDEVRQIMLDGMIGKAEPVETAPQEAPVKQLN
jgi:tetratricopeptide (TPR) repeat protein